jgi:hypothetical protein
MIEKYDCGLVLFFRHLSLPRKGVSKIYKLRSDEQHDVAQI